MLPQFFAGNRKFALIGLVFFALIQASLAIVVVFNMRTLFSSLRNGTGAIPIELITLIAVCTLGIIGLRILERTLAEKTGHDYTMELRLQLFSHLTRVSQEKLDQQQQGALNLRFIGDLNAIKNWVSLGIPRLIAASILLPALLYLLYWLHPLMFAFASVWLLLGVSLLYVFRTTLFPYHRTVRNRRGNIASYMNERLRFAPQTRISGQRNQVLKSLKNKSLKLRSAAIKKSLVSGGYKAIPDICLTLISATCFGLAFYLNLSAAEAAIILAIISIFSQPLKDVAGFWDRRNAFNVASKKCVEILNIPSVTKGRKVVPEHLLRPDIEINRLIFKSLRFKQSKIECGDKVLITGSNGCGKSSYLKMLAGITKPRRGTIKIGGANVLKIPEHLRSQLIFYQGTEIPIFKGTLKQAMVIYCNTPISDETLIKTLELFDLMSVFKRLGGLTGRIEESGRNLSAGERKKIALCRAWLCSSRILMLDEIDDALDKSSVSLVYKLVAKPNTTVLLVSHRELDANQFNNTIDLTQR